VSGRLERRLATLRTLEWVNVAWLAVVLLWWLPAQRGVPIPGQTWQRTVAYLPVAGLLLLGGWYWHRKLQQRRGRRPLDDALPVLDRLERISARVLVAATVAVAASWLTWTGTTTDRAWATGLVLFAVAEHVNYFRVHLMHDTRSDLRRLRTTRRLRRSWLAADLAAWRGVSRPCDGRNPATRR
jgi:hypothetical protein